MNQVSFPMSTMFGRLGSPGIPDDPLTLTTSMSPFQAPGDAMASPSRAGDRSLFGLEAFGDPFTFGFGEGNWAGEIVPFEPRSLDTPGMPGMPMMPGMGGGMMPMPMMPGMQGGMMPMPMMPQPMMPMMPQPMMPMMPQPMMPMMPQPMMPMMPQPMMQGGMMMFDPMMMGGMMQGGMMPMMPGMQGGMMPMMFPF